MDLYTTALDRLNGLIKEARSRGVTNAEAAALATADSRARPSVRMITVLAVEPEGPLFFANETSGKGRQLDENPRASLCFYWTGLQEQVIIEGDVEKQSPETSDHYWQRRLRESQLAAWASDQSTPVEEKGSVKRRAGEYKSRFNYDRVGRQEYWHAFRILPDRIDFWPTGWQRMRERVRYRRDASGTWHQEMLGP